MTKDTMYGKKPVPCEKKKDHGGLGTALGAVMGSADRNIAIEFECGDCCKKVLNGQEISIVGNFIILKPDNKEELMVKLFSGGALVERQTAEVAVIPINRICSIEFGAVELDDMCDYD